MQGFHSYMSRSTDAEGDAVVSSTRSFSDRNPMTAAFLLVEGVLVVLAVVLFAVGDPMAPKATTAAMLGGIVTVIALMIAAVGVLVLVANGLIRVYVSLQSSA